MAGILQNGTVTPGHLAQWVTDGIIQDAGPPDIAQRVLGQILAANFSVTSDQVILLNPSVQVFAITGIIITNATISLTSATGGFYPAASKAGSPIVSAAQTYGALTTPNVLMNATLSGFANTTRFSAANLSVLPNAGALSSLAIYFSLTVPQGSQANADIYILGLDLTP